MVAEREKEKEKEKGSICGVAYVAQQSCTYVALIGAKKILINNEKRTWNWESVETKGTVGR